MAPLLHFTGIKEKIFTPVPSLECIAAIKIASTLWNRSHIRLLLCNHRSAIRLRWDTFRWYEAINTAKKFEEIIERKVRDNAKELMLHKVLKNKVEKAVYHISRQISRWKSFHEYRFAESQDYDAGQFLPSHLFWTAFGTIDRKKTAQAFVKDSSVCVEVRYKFACMYCLDKDIAELWKELPAGDKINFKNNCNDWENIWSEIVNYEINDECWDNISVKSKNLEHFWNCVMGGGVDVESILTINYYQPISDFLLQQVQKEDNLAALQYFFPKLTQEMRGLFLERFVEEYYHSGVGGYFTEDVFFFLLSLLDGAKQKTMLQVQRTCSCTWHVLVCCLHWSWNTLFMPVAHCLFPFLTALDFEMVLYSAVNNQELSIEFFTCGPEDYKQYVVNRCHEGLLLLSFKRGNKRLTQLIWKLATREKREYIMNEYEESIYCYYEEECKIEKNEHYEHFFLFLIKLCREERKRNCSEKK